MHIEDLVEFIFSVGFIYLVRILSVCINCIQMSALPSHSCIPYEIYLDIETGYYVFVGMRGRTHIFTIENLHHTSFRTTKYNRFERQISGKWEIEL